jgi:CheY-like chemotaxis protein
VVLDEDYARQHAGVTSGRYVVLAVSDTGVGMDKALQARIFEPFFTTKEKGKGTGLGLSTVFGIVQQSGGHIWVYSEEGKGASFKIYLPHTDESRRAGIGDQRGLTPRSGRGSETILLVEDEDQVRVLARDVLRRSGYDVIDAQNAAEALAIAERHTGRIHMLLTDVVMPKVGGPELARRLVPRRPDMKVLYMSGYTDDAIINHGIRESGIAFLEKPLTPHTLIQKVRETLDQPGAPKPAHPAG